MDFNALQQWLHQQTELWQRTSKEQEPIDADSIDWEPLLAASRQLAAQQGIGLQSELADAMTEQLQGFCRYGLRLLQQLRAPSDSDNLQTLALEFSHHLEQQALIVLLRQWRLPETLRRFIAASGTAQSDTLSPFSGVDQLLQLLAPQLNDPRLQAIGTELRQFNHSLQRYQSRLQQLHHDTAHTLLRRLQGSHLPQSLTELHALWVDCYENGYGEMLREPVYQQLYAGLTNSSLRLTRLGRDYWQQEYRHLGLVPQQDYDDLARSHHALRKQLRRSEAQQQQILDKLGALEAALNSPDTGPAQSAAQPPVTPLRKRKA